MGLGQARGNSQARLGVWGSASHPKEKGDLEARDNTFGFFFSPEKPCHSHVPESAPRFPPPISPRTLDHRCQGLSPEGPSSLNLSRSLKTPTINSICL